MNDGLRSNIDGSDDLYSNPHTTLLGLHNALDPSGFSASMLTYGSQLSLPNFILTSKEQHREIRNMHAKELMRVLTSLSYPESTWDQPPSYLPKNLEAGAEVFLRNETGSGAFDCRFTGPFLLMNKDKKHGTIFKDGRNLVVSLDHLKPKLYQEDTGGSCGGHEAKK